MINCPTCKGSGKIVRPRNALAFPKPVARARLKAKKRAQHRDEIAEIRAEVLERANGKCEACLLPCRDPRLDHWLGGSGRRREQQSAATCWALCAKCDEARTHNQPNASFWNRVFQLHCDRHGLEFRAHIEKPALAQAAPRLALPPARST